MPRRTSHPRGAIRLRVLLVDTDAARAGEVQAGLESAGFLVVGVSADTADLVGLVRESQADVIVCDLDDPSRDALESMRALNRDEPRPVVVFASRGDSDQIAAALDAGVAAYVVEGLSPARVRPVLEVAIRRFRAFQSLVEERNAARATLADRTLIERAKGILMQRRRLSEPDAYKLMRRWSMDRGLKMVAVAEDILSEK